MKHHRAIASDGIIYVRNEETGFYEPEEERLERYPLWLTSIIWLAALSIGCLSAVGVGYCIFMAAQALAS